MEDLNKNEEAVIRILWEIKRGVVRDVIAKMPDPKPPYTTVSSVIRFLEKKGYVGHKAYGKTHEYFPLISKSAYLKQSFNNFLKNYFEGSAEKVVSFMVKEKKLHPKEVEEIKRLIEDYEQGIKQS